MPSVAAVNPPKSARAQNVLFLPQGVGVGLHPSWCPPFSSNGFWCRVICRGIILAGRAGGKISPHCHETVLVLRLLWKSAELAEDPRSLVWGVSSPVSANDMAISSASCSPSCTSSSHCTISPSNNRLVPRRRLSPSSCRSGWCRRCRAIVWISVAMVRINCVSSLLPAPVSITPTVANRTLAAIRSASPGLQICAFV